MLLTSLLFRTERLFQEKDMLKNITLINKCTGMHITSELFLSNENIFNIYQNKMDSV